MKEEGSRSAQFKVSAVAREDNVGFPHALFMTTYTSLPVKFTSCGADARALLPNHSD